jgi:hypothetical protein
MSFPLQIIVPFPNLTSMHSKNDKITKLYYTTKMMHKIYLYILFITPFLCLSLKLSFISHRILNPFTVPIYPLNCSALVTYLLAIRATHLGERFSFSHWSDFFIQRFWHLLIRKQWLHKSPSIFARLSSWNGQQIHTVRL